MKTYVARKKVSVFDLDDIVPFAAGITGDTNACSATLLSFDMLVRIEIQIDHHQTVTFQRDFI